MPNFLSEIRFPKGVCRQRKIPIICCFATTLTLALFLFFLPCRSARLIWAVTPMPKAQGHSVIMPCTPWDQYRISSATVSS